ncbi:MAG: VWA domain-containing protein [Elusimicrobia bacterium]|nr:VWA domain-containing protein [Elusimicrobiota bacterium]
MNQLKTVLTGVIFACAAAVPAQAQRLIAWPIGRPPPIFMPPIVRPMPPIPRPDMIPLPLKEQKVEGRVRMQVAQLWIETVFRNESSARLEGEILMPIPGDAVIDKMEMKVGDKLLKAELLNADQARTTYENIVRQMRDPALLELQGERLVRARVFPIEPNSSVTLRFNYTQILPKAGALYSLKLPLARIDGAGGGRSVKVGFESQAPMRLLYSPTHSVDIDRQGDKKATVGYKTGGSEGELVVLYSLDEGKMASSLLTYREAGEEGFFMLSLSPSVKTDAKSQPKDVVFVVDRSGSMEDDGKMEQARKALKSTLNRLGADDRFGIVDFATGVESMSESLIAATDEGKNRGRRYADKIEASGGTNIKEAMDTALDLLGKGGAAGERMPMLVFLTDGLPTVGETNTDELLRAVHSRNKSVKARFFCLGAGKDVNSLFIDKLAEGQRGSRDYVLPGEDIEVKLGQLVDRIAKPAITDVEFEWNRVEAAQVYPKGIHDIYHGDPVVLVGRYPKEGKGALVLKGKAAGGAVRQEFPLALPKEATENDYLPRLWAHRKVAHLLDEIRLTGSKNPEIVDEVLKLAKRYGIVTPYTSLLIAEDSDMAQLRNRGRVMFDRMEGDAGRPVPMPAPAAAPGAGPEERRFALDAVRGQAFSRNLMAMKSAAAAPSIAESLSGAAGAAAGSGAAGYYDFELSGGRAGDKEEKLKKLASEMRTVGSKTFYKRGEEWVDGAYELDRKPAVTEVVFLSDAYFDLLRKHPETRSWLALGRRVTFVLGGKAYRIVEK